MTRPTHPPLAVAFVANIDGARRLPTLRPILDKYRPDFIVLEECPRWREWFSGLRGYRIAEVAPFVEGDRRSTVTLVRRGVKVEHSWLIRVRRRWFGPHGNPHDGRAMTPLRLRLRNDEPTDCPDCQNRLRVLPAHFPTKRGDNLPAWEEALRKGERFLERDGDSPLVLVGDVNAGRSIIDPWARERGYDTAWFGPVDAAIGSGCKVTTLERFHPAAGHGWGICRIDTKEN